MNQLSKLHIEGFRSIKNADIPLRALNVLIGANGAGKSNLIDFFRMLSYALTRGFQAPYLVERGPASAILHFGAKVTPLVRAELSFNTPDGTNTYRFSLADSTGDRLTFTREEVQFHREGEPLPTPPIPVIPRPSDESGLSELWSENDPTVLFIKKMVSRCRVYQFHDTSLTSHMRDACPVDRNRNLTSDGGNLPAVLLAMRKDNPENYASIVRTLRLVLPWFDEFILEPQGPAQKQRVLLRWRMAGRTEYEFDPGQISDGSLRLMALVTLLLQPVDKLPSLLLVDEPELGLHPVAEQVLAGLLKSVARETQVIVATQSATFLNYFEPQDVMVVEHENAESNFIRQNPDELASWLKRYSLGDVWNKNLIGGRP
ncbi:MAG: AAA family ATPase [Prosthecobacter sp.]|uniref:AAA family ATPase n=1 Tax=Prosthecobacter sp. TaxID=1965333 RepID=UPI003902C750